MDLEGLQCRCWSLPDLALLAVLVDLVHRQAQLTQLLQLVPVDLADRPCQLARPSRLYLVDLVLLWTLVGLVVRPHRQFRLGRLDLAGLVFLSFVLKESR